MKRYIFLALVVGSSLFASDEIDSDKLSEALGHLIVRQLDNPGFDFNLDKVIQGMRDEQANKPSPMNEEEYEQTVYSIQEKLFIEVAEKNLAEATAFLRHNAEEENIQSIDEKLQYKIAKEGEGAEIQSESTPMIHYKGSLIDGTVFADSHESGEPIALPMGQTIPGFAKGLVGMKEGEKRVIYIHPELAYGIAGQLPPNSLLIFEVEVVQADTKLDAIAKR